MIGAANSGPLQLQGAAGARREARVPAAFAAAVERSRQRAAVSRQPRPPLRLTGGWDRYILGILIIGLLLALSWIGALWLFPDQVALALAPALPTERPTPAATAGLPATPTTVSRGAAPPTATFTATIIPTATPTLAATGAPPATETATPATAGPPLNIPTRLVIPAIGLDAPIVPVAWSVVQREDGSSEMRWEVAGHAAGWHVNSVMPGQPGNVVLSGHHNIEGMVFRDLHRLKLGDEIVVHAGAFTHRYRVVQTLVLQEAGVPQSRRDENARWIGPFPDERLTLVSCWPQWDNTHRVVVVAKPLAAIEPPRGDEGFRP